MRLIRIFTALIAVLMLSGCVMDGSVPELEERVEEMRQEIESLEDDLSKLEEENAGLAADSSELEIENGKLRREKSELKQTITALEMDMAELREINELLERSASPYGVPDASFYRPAGHLGVTPAELDRCFELLVQQPDWSGEVVPLPEAIIKQNELGRQVVQYWILGKPGDSRESIAITYVLDVTGEYVENLYIMGFHIFDFGDFEMKTEELYKLYDAYESVLVCAYVMAAGGDSEYSRQVWSDTVELFNTGSYQDGLVLMEHAQSAERIYTRIKPGASDAGAADGV